MGRGPHACWRRSEPRGKHAFQRRTSLWGMRHGQCSPSATLVVTMDFSRHGEAAPANAAHHRARTDGHRASSPPFKLGKQCAKTPSVDGLARTTKRCIDQPDRADVLPGKHLCRGGLHRILRRHGGRRHLRRGVRRAHPLQEKFAPRCPNMLMFNLLCSFLAGVGHCATRYVRRGHCGAGILGADITNTNASGRNPLIHLDKMLIISGVLLIPASSTNAIIDMLVVATPWPVPCASWRRCCGSGTGGRS